MTIIATPTRSLAFAAAKRLNTLSPLDPDGAAAIGAAAQRPRLLRPQDELLVEGEPIREAVLFLEGWAARVRQLPDGPRAILSFILPGDVVGLSELEHPRASATIVALTRAVVCPAPARGLSRALDRAYAMSRAADETHLIAQVARLCRLNAYDRIADLMLELLERLEVAGLAVQGRFEFPLTQEMISDATGLSTVHVNRMLQQARRAGDLTWSNQRVQIRDAAALRRTIGRAVAGTPGQRLAEGSRA